ncbi:predicted protein [Nematostella vectensis]|uniref:Mitochondrial import receptor subunit TOM7 homolog n=1 Tax=Nematostella vectensis TaxID=45351 RepID=A7RUQ7_NEMVE|nr:predicted protein [Nematostella vectensis]|eukprot:XP_001636802.1 predicted protein [Nematostella vectensis]
MAKMKPETKKRVQTVIKYSKTAFHWGFIPLIIYLGLKRGADPGMPEPTLLRVSHPKATRPREREFKTRVLAKLWTKKHLLLLLQNCNETRRDVPQPLKDYNHFKITQGRMSDPLVYRTNIRVATIEIALAKLICDLVRSSLIGLLQLSASFF